jgi:hypothetical protein
LARTELFSLRFSLSAMISVLQFSHLLMT